MSEEVKIENLKKTLTFDNISGELIYKEDNKNKKILFELVSASKEPCIETDRYYFAMYGPKGITKFQSMCIKKGSWINWEALKGNTYDVYYLKPVI